MLGNLSLKTSPDVKGTLMEKLGEGKDPHSMFPRGR